MSVPDTSFADRSQKALKDSGLRNALAHATNRLATARAQAFRSLPDPDGLRDHARRIRAHTLACLDQYLVQFAEAAERRGACVYWADTAAAANRYVVDLARTRGVKRVVKAKSMVSEELELNRALADAGVRVVETDLGEYIIQLAEERPSHIVVPAVHKTKEDVAELFRQKLGASPGEVATIPAMTAFARRTLRDEYLQADMGISGANFGVAETGSLCIVTNEGNGRLTTTAPPLHVAIVGIERLVPTFEDLGVLLSLLARSATGQKLSVYTNIITGPRRPGPASAAGEATDEPDGPDELHIVLVDNGRSRILGSELAEILYCIRCGSCLNACPVYRLIGGHAYGGVYPGPVGAVVTPALYGLDDWIDLPHASSLCGACREICPVRIDLPGLLLKLRAEGDRRGLGPWWLKWGIALYGLVAIHPGLYRLSARAAGWVTRALARDGWVTRLPPPLSAWTDHRDFPVLARRSFSESWNARGTKS